MLRIPVSLRHPCQPFPAISEFPGISASAFVATQRASVSATMDWLPYRPPCVCRNHPLAPRERTQCRDVLPTRLEAFVCWSGPDGAFGLTKATLKRVLRDDVANVSGVSARVGLHVAAPRLFVVDPRGLSPLSLTLVCSAPAPSSNRENHHHPRAARPDLSVSCSRPWFPFADCFMRGHLPFISCDTLSNRLLC
jgi:hypothetical protein